MENTPKKPDSSDQPIVFCDGKFNLTPMERAVYTNFGRFFKEMEESESSKKNNKSQ